MEPKNGVTTARPYQDIDREKMKMIIDETIDASRNDPEVESLTERDRYFLYSDFGI